MSMDKRFSRHALISVFCLDLITLWHLSRSGHGWRHRNLLLCITGFWLKHIALPYCSCPLSGHHEWLLFKLTGFVIIILCNMFHVWLITRSCTGNYYQLWSPWSPSSILNKDVLCDWTALAEGLNFTLAGAHMASSLSLTHTQKLLFPMRESAEHVVTV